MDNELSVSQDHGISMSRPPEMVLAEAKKAAEALDRVLKGKAKPVKFNGEQYMEFEDWQLLGKFYGLSAKVTSTEAVEFGDVRGFLARASVVDSRTGIEVSAAEGMCLNDEDKWSTRAKYEYVGGNREKVGDVAVPMFQLRSMAQTRACAKALRTVLAWVVVLAGYRPNVAEEMMGDEHPGNAPSTPPPAPKATAPDSSIITIPATKIETVDFKPTKTGGKKFSISVTGGILLHTFDQKIANLADGALRDGASVHVSYRKGPYGFDIVEMSILVGE